MNSIKISELWTAGTETIRNSVFFNLLEQISNKPIIFTNPRKADILFIGPYNLEKISKRVKSSILRRLDNPNLEKFFEKYEKNILFSKNKPLTIFYCHENIRTDKVKADFSISYDFSTNDEKHLRFPIWKENIDWSSENILRKKSFIINRYGEFYDLKKLQAPLREFNNKKKNMCIFSSHMNEPRKSFYLKLKKYFEIDGYGPYFDKKIKNHNVSGFYKKDILKNYFYNLCPHNGIYPGYYEEKVPESYLSGCIPVTWADNNISTDFNIKAFINLNDSFFKDSKNFVSKMMDDSYLKNFLNEPLIDYDLNLKKERDFVTRIVKLIS